MSVRPFDVKVSQHTLDDLHDRLARTRWPDEIEDGDWSYGTSREYLKELTEHWLTEFDWREQEHAPTASRTFAPTLTASACISSHERGKGVSPLPIVLTTATRIRSCVF